MTYEGFAAAWPGRKDPEGFADRWRLLVYPIVLWHGKRLFDETSQSKLKLVSTKAYSSGVVGLTYHL